jgi:hypothetical protein
MTQEASSRTFCYLSFEIVAEQVKWQGSEIKDQEKFRGWATTPYALK